ncbi:chemotaxis protein CheA [Thermococcus profundus]|uniref:Chemotaxis protein CheA n=1 Tax=Thermococcus profundus TaxID=49899 RepID=A0A2Z2MBJ4_THEPR|nr:chemotaxis protein CheA [Thermococcus profundus]ASJ02873.1 chemotaxis protein CheA [Thermococcus profundus]
MEDMSQYIEEFLADARDRIDSISNAVLKLEDAVKKGDEAAKKESIDQIFRDAHTLKGTAATMGFMKLSETAHKMENLFDAIRNGVVEATPEVVDLVLEFIDAIETMVDNIEETGSEGDVDISEIFAEADKLLKGYTRKKKEGAESKKAEESPPETAEAPEEKEAPKEAPQPLEVGGGNEYLIKVIFHPDAQLKGVRAFLILNDLEERGDVLETKPDRKIIEDGSAEENELEFRVRTEFSPEEIEKVITRHPEVKEVVITPIGGGSAEERAEEAPSEAPGGGKVKIKVILQKDAPLKGIRSFLILQDLQGMGKVIETNPSRDAIQNGELIDGTYFEVVMIPQKSIDEIKAAVLKHPDVEDVVIGGESAKEGEKTGETAGGTKPEKKPESKASQPPKREKIKMSKLIKVDVAHLDKLMNLVGELVINKGRLEQIAERLGDRELIETLSTTSRLMTELQDEIMQMRLTPVAEVFNKFPRMVRSLARKEGKEVEFIMEGTEIEVDRTILDKLGDVLVHLLRNAIDHGIEPPEEREKLGKPRAGRLELIAKRERSHVVIIVRDDGRGIDPEKVKKKAIEKGLITPEQAAEMSKDEAINLIFLPGFSTAEKVTDVSGRGVGMDVVQDVIKALNGSISVKTEVGKGTTFTLKLPISMAIIQALLIKVQDETYAIPINNILETIEVKKDDLKTIGGKEVIVLRGEIIPLISLHELFNLPYPESEEFPAIIVDFGAQKIALRVDELLHKKDIVIKSLGKALSNLKGFAGATILGDGSVVLIVDINSLLGGIGGGL